MKKLSKLLLAVALCASFTGCGSKDEETPIRIQFVPTNTDTADATTKAFEEYMEGLLETDVEVTVATNYNTIVEAMQSKQVDVGIMPPAAYAQAKSLDAAKVILSSTLVDYDANEMPVEGTKVGTFKAEVLVRADSGIDSYEDLVGKKVAYLGASSASGYVYPVAEMKELGLDFDTSTWTEISVVTNAMQAVINGQVDACFVFEGARWVFQNAGLLDAEGNTIDSFEKMTQVLSVAKLSDADIPNDAVAVNPELDEATITAIQEAFLTMASTEEGLEIMSCWGHTGYVEADESAYDATAKYIEKAAE